MKTSKHLLHAILNARNIANNISFNPPSHNPVSDYTVMPMLQIKKLKLSDLKSCKPVKNSQDSEACALTSPSAPLEEAS